LESLWSNQSSLIRTSLFFFFRPSTICVLRSFRALGPHPVYLIYSHSSVERWIYRPPLPMSPPGSLYLTSVGFMHGGSFYYIGRRMPYIYRARVIMVSYSQWSIQNVPIKLRCFKIALVVYMSNAIRPREHWKRHPELSSRETPRWENM
jgi:hypothetical protein